jgi:hypothetical protein
MLPDAPMAELIVRACMVAVILYGAAMVLIGIVYAPKMRRRP